MKRSPWIPLDANFQDDEQIIELSAEAELLFIRSMALARRLDTGGAVRRGQLRRLTDKMTTDPTALAEELVAVDLWSPVPSGWEIPSWVSWNGRADGRRQSMSDGGKRGNHERWQHPGPFETCDRCHKSAGQSGGDPPPNRRGEETTTPPNPPESTGPDPGNGWVGEGGDGGEAVRIADQLVAMLGALDEGADGDEIDLVQKALDQGWTEPELLQCAQTARSNPTVRDIRRYLFGMLRKRATAGPEPGGASTSTTGGGWEAAWAEAKRVLGGQWRGVDFATTGLPERTAAALTRIRRMFSDAGATEHTTRLAFRDAYLAAEPAPP